MHQTQPRILYLAIRINGKLGLMEEEREMSGILLLLLCFDERGESEATSALLMVEGAAALCFLF